MRSFTKISPSLWKSKKFLTLRTDKDRLFYLFALTNNHQISAGVYHLPTAYAAEDLGWSSQEVIDSRKACVSAGLIMFDDETSELLITQWFVHNPPMNDRHSKGAKKQIERTQSDFLRTTALEELKMRMPSERLTKKKRKPRKLSSRISEIT